MADKRNAMDHLVFVMFENRSLDNLLGHLYGPDDGKQFEGVIGKDLSNPVPEWAEHQPPDGSGSIPTPSSSALWTSTTGSRSR